MSCGTRLLPNEILPFPPRWRVVSSGLRAEIYVLTSDRRGYDGRRKEVNYWN